MLINSKVTNFLEKASPEEIIQWCFDIFNQKNIVVTTSCSLPVTIDLLNKQINNYSISIPVIFINTLHHFPETIETAHRLKKYYNLDLRIFKVKGIESKKEFVKVYGNKLWEHNVEQFHYLTKIEPLERALRELDAQVWITGRRRDQSSNRKQMPIIEKDRRGCIKVNPLANWSAKDLWRYIIRNKVPYNPLHDRGYTSIGDEPLTTPVIPGEAERNGRWRGMGKTECGLHPVYGQE